MGFFDAFKTDDKIAGKCAYCGADIVEHFAHSSDKLIQREGCRTLDGIFLCPKCLKQKGVDKKTIESTSSDAVYSDMASRNVLSPKEFTPDKRIMWGDYYPYIEIDTTRKIINIPEFNIHLFGKDEYIDHPYRFSEIIDFQLLDNGQQIAEGSSLLGAAVGGLTFGGAGAIVGSQLSSRKIAGECTELRIKIVLSNINNSSVYINFISKKGEEGKRDSDYFKEKMEKAQEIMSILTVIMNENKSAAAQNDSQSSANNMSFDFADAIRKLSELHAAGLLTDAEFENKKSDILARI